MNKSIKLLIHRPLFYYLPFFLISLVLPLSNVKVFDLFGSSIQPSHLIFIFLLFISLISIGLLRKFKYFLFYSFIPLLGLINVTSLIEFVKSYVIFLIILLSLLYIIPVFKKLPSIIKIKIIIFFLSISYILGIFGIIQFIFLNIFDDLSFFNFFGNFQFHPHLPNTLFGFHRATSVYLEPSFFGWVSLTNISFTLFLMKNKLINPFLSIYLLTSFLLFSLFTLSSSTFLNIGFILTFYLVFFIKRPVIVTIILIIGFSYITLNYLDQIAVLRLSSIFVPGSSGYDRIVQPIISTIEVLTKYPFLGRGLGQIGVINQEFINDSYIFNGIFGFIYALGLSSLFYIIPIFVLLKKSLNINMSILILVLNLILIFFSTGEIFGLNTTAVILMSVLLGSIHNSKLHNTFLKS